MRRLLGILLLIMTVALIYLLDKQHGAGTSHPLPPLGRLLDPVHGFWENAERKGKDLNINEHLKSLQQPVTVWLDERSVPHIRAANDHDLYFVQGYIHAYFRLWQMDLQTRAAAGRVSEVIGHNDKVIQFDIMQRRKGMVYGAQNSLKAMEADHTTKLMMDAYTDGVNYYINGLKYKEYPLEYKLMDFAPEQWTNLKSMLLLKYMADELTGETDDIALTYLRDKLSPTDFDMLYPEKITGSKPVIPEGTKFDKPSLKTLPVPNDSVFPHYDAPEFADFNTSGKGSNNWAIAPLRTASGAAILCNDPHLALNLPSLWYEIQLQMPEMNVYGVSLPGAPGVVIGFNDSISWGMTNNYRDVKDFYAIKEVSGSKDKYWMNGTQLDYGKKIEEIKVKNENSIYDTVLYTVHGPIIYDAKHPAPGGLKKPIALCWMAHRQTNELSAVYLLNRARNYNEFVNALMHYTCPAQNFIYADRNGHIALWGQGQFVNKWKGQGKYVMNGADTATLWHELIPMMENPHAVDPPQGYLYSANQSVTDSTYPYWYNGKFLEFRSWQISKLLNHLQKATIHDVFEIQGDTYSFLANQALPVMLKNLSVDIIHENENWASFKELQKWSYKMDKDSHATIMFQIWWRKFKGDLWAYLKDIPDKLYPNDERTMQLIQGDTLIKMMVNGETFHNHVVAAVNKSFAEMKKEYDPRQSWYEYKNTTALHLAKIQAFSYDHLPIGGWKNTINAASGDHGPSWRMVVQMGKEIEAYGIYPGGQSGNPGSQHYADFLEKWAAGQYYRLDFLPNSEKQSDTALKYIWTLQP